MFDGYIFQPSFNIILLQKLCAMPQIPHATITAITATIVEKPIDSFFWAELMLIDKIHF